MEPGEYRLYSNKKLKIDSFQFTDVQNSSTAFNTPNLRVYPNPANHSFKIDGLLEAATNLVKVYSIQGALVLEQTLTPENNMVNTQNLPSGAYWLHIQGNQHVYRQALIINKD